MMIFHKKNRFETIRYYLQDCNNIIFFSYSYVYLLTMSSELDGSSGSFALLTLPDGSIHKLPILNGTQGPPMLDIRNLYSQTGHFTFDPGFTCTGSCESRITFIDGDAGILQYRGYTIETVAENCDYIEVCYSYVYPLTISSELDGICASYFT